MIKSELIFEVFHVGSMDISKRSQYQAEGKGLNVSVNPHEWCIIARGKVFGDFHKLNKSNAQFALFDHSLVNDCYNWGVEKGYLKKVLNYTYSEYSDDLDEILSYEYGSLEEAKDNVFEDYWDDIEEHESYKTTAKMKKALCGTELPNYSPNTEIFLLYVKENHPELDGVWFNFKLDTFAYSAPSGIIFDHKIKEWSDVVVEPETVDKAE